MKSGDYSISHDEKYYRKEFSEISDRNFEQRTFSPRPALRAKEPVDGPRMWQDYLGQTYDKSKFELVEGMWDHEHCSVCWFTIKEGYTYWENADRKERLCDLCYEALTKI
jgi:hypothetical protein